jgi:HTH-type transcriptional repressor of NAD biosynthesis genes
MTDMKYKNGLVLGKFYPFHEGHKFLIESANTQCEKLTVLVCSLQNETIPGNLRYDWIRQTFKSADINVVHITDELMQYPRGDEDEFFWDIWTGIIMRELPDIDVIFTSEDYGKELAKRISFKYPNMHIDSVDVDTLRKTYPVSGTAIRDNPLENWQYIPTIAKPYFMKKIILVGPESTGKTELSKALAKHYGGEYVPEYGRTYEEEYVKGEKRQFELDDLEYIAMGHVKHAKEIALRNAENGKNNHILILDTDSITTQIWSEIYFKKVPEKVMSLQNDYIQKGDLYLLMDIDIPWVDDGMREFPMLRRWHHGRIEQELIKRDLNYVKIDGNFDERFDRAIGYIDKYLKYITHEKNAKYFKIYENNFELYTI